ncbi:hypothetical protein Q4Q35_08185 [Flavivirga aquimarina]|uniref:Lipocalin-like domain-containing protein n=1 Tax=Flavivirga aquimarina TaxID=2027862 RepID=A0ABT8W9G6_9FLAO|nr:hypothetical protein [Flavivirga aquimarina]MDO5969783.1 hypothetical protein [Flavivirga aquimarina]
MRIIILTLLLVVFSCTESEDIIFKKFKGQWSISEIKYNNLNYKDYLNSNVLILKKNNEISIPETVHFNEDRFSFWSFKLDQENQVLLNIESSNHAFRGVFNVEFIKDEKKKLAGMILKSDSIYIKAYKLLQNYNDW